MTSLRYPRRQKNGEASAGALYGASARCSTPVSSLRISLCAAFGDSNSSAIWRKASSRSLKASRVNRTLYAILIFFLQLGKSGGGIDQFPCRSLFLTGYQLFINRRQGEAALISFHAHDDEIPVTVLCYEYRLLRCVAEI